MGRHGILLGGVRSAYWTPKDTAFPIKVNAVILPLNILLVAEGGVLARFTPRFILTGEFNRGFAVVNTVALLASIQVNFGKADIVSCDLKNSAVTE